MEFDVNALQILDEPESEFGLWPCQVTIET
ncbi:MULTISPECIES: ALQxL family class IV lanthipeptide [unclassified Crossiella]|nr:MULTISPECIES: ALQxL family class IV lanthipeptide [unclassified Crossiella]MCK2244162.1 ALQxL family class IV lanthipeptide [Crossiella sp. S99.2]MCK2257966.1 ALQxL family class IV lanthipeptide [Crossiella sp. S99.1]